jgi:hypothetical protein
VALIGVFAILFPFIFVLIGEWAQTMPIAESLCVLALLHVCCQYTPCTRTRIVVARSHWNRRH